jgi:hypothetical protein
MKLLFVAERGDERFEIAEAPEGFYVFRYERTYCSHDPCQGDLMGAYECAEEEWGVAPSDWRPPHLGEGLLQDQAHASVRPVSESKPLVPTNGNALSELASRLSQLTPAQAAELAEYLRMRARQQNQHDHKE